jgi:hypothetical protein
MTDLISMLEKAGWDDGLIARYFKGNGIGNMCGRDFKRTGTKRSPYGDSVRRVRERGVRIKAGTASVIIR